MSITKQRSQSERVTCCMIPTLGHSGKGKAVETGGGSVVARGDGGSGGGRREWGEHRGL